MKAEEARQIAIDAVSKEIVTVIRIIEDEAKKGHTQVTINNLNQGVRAYLKDKGYDISEIFYDKYAQAIIKW